MKRKTISIDEVDWKKLDDYKNKTKTPYWFILKQIIEGKIKLEDKK